MNINNEQLESIVKRYVLDQLNQQEAEEFEAYFLSRPDIADMIDSVQKMQIGLQTSESAAIHISNREQGQTTMSRGSGWLANIGRIVSGPIPSMAMLTLLVLSAPFTLQGLVDSDSGRMDAQLVRLETGVQRSADLVQGANLDAGGKHAALVVRVEEVEFPNYRFQIKTSAESKELWRSDNFAFASGSRDYLLLIPPVAARDNVLTELIGINENGSEENVKFCNYTESCF